MASAAFVVLGLFAIQRSFADLEREPGIDFYTNWAVGTARTLAPRELGTPYANPDGYSAVLADHATRLGSARLRLANQLVPRLDPTPTPLYFTAFAWLPKRYGPAQTTWRAVQWIAFVLAFAWLARISRCDVWLAAALFGVAAWTYDPLLADVTVGNVNTVQWFAFVAAFALVRALERRPRPFLGACLVSWLVAISLAKPNVALLPLLLVPWLARKLGSRAFALSLAAGAATGAALLALSSWYFASARAWPDWFEYVSRTVDFASYPHWGGNLSVTALCNEKCGVARGVPAVMALVLAASWAAAVALGRGVAGLRAGARAAFDDGAWLVSAAIVATLAAAPLVWLHYGMLALLPIFVFLARGRTAPGRAALAGLAFVAYGGIIGPLVETLGLEHAITYAETFAWLPLWVALLIDARLASPPV
ncbi:MAG: glycosyltransferase 87 family protein [Planctomycetes bacterium]|nr:glycosyltransferase 87 family protein [Planctomycetota bacterium]